MKKKGSGKFKCGHCGERFRNPPKLAEHYKSKPSHQSEKSRKLAAQKRAKRLAKTIHSTTAALTGRLPTVRGALPKPTVKFCTQCGVRRAASHKFCGGCGGKL